MREGKDDADIAIDRMCPNKTRYNVRAECLLKNNDVVSGMSVINAKGATYDFLCLALYFRSNGNQVTVGMKLSALCGNHSDRKRK